jgi:YjbE family integral membrane protein
VEHLLESSFWIGLLQIIGVNVVLSGDNAVVIALASRGLPQQQRGKAIFWGSLAAIVLRVILTVAAVEVLRSPWLKLVGAALLLWIGAKLLIPEEDDDGGGGPTAANLIAAIRTILIADLVMSLDNVIAVAAAAKGSLLLLILGLLISIPLIIFGSTLLLKVMDRFPIIITLGAALLGYVAGDMAITDPVVKDWIEAHGNFLHLAAPAAGAIFVVVAGKWFAARKEKELVAAAPQEVYETAPAKPKEAKVVRFLVPVDGSATSLHAIEHMERRLARYSEPEAVEIHLVNVQRPLSGDVDRFVSEADRRAHHQEQGLQALREAQARLDKAGIAHIDHVAVGTPGVTIARYAADLQCDQIVMGTHGAGAGVQSILGSVAVEVVQHASVPVTLVK